MQGCKVLKVKRTFHAAKNALRGREVTGLIPGRDQPMVLVARLLTLGFVGGRVSIRCLG